MQYLFITDDNVCISYQKNLAYEFSVICLRCHKLVQSIGMTYATQWAFPVAQTVKNLPAMQNRIRSLGWEDALEKEMATHSSILPRESHGQRCLAGYSTGGHKSQTQLSD